MISVFSLQVEVNKKREQEISKMRKDMESSNQQYEQTLSTTRQKFNAQLQEAQDEMDLVKKAKAK